LNARFTQVVPEELNDRINELKEKFGMSKNSIVNAAIEEYVRTRDTETLEKRVSELEKEVFKNEKGK
jgi:predicted DNA-binding protein